VSSLKVWYIVSMKEYFLAGFICLLNPVNERPHCIQFYEDPRIYYSLEVCKDKAHQKVNEIGANFTEKGFNILNLKVFCLVDNSEKNT